MALLKKKKINKGTLPPLFDRIVVDKSDPETAGALLDARQLKESIVSELALVLNTRCTVRKVIYLDHIESIPLFGLPDFFGLGDLSSFDGTNLEAWPQIARFIETAIGSAEPRLKDIRVAIDRFDPLDQALAISVVASLKESPLMKDIHFPLTLYTPPVGRR